MHIESEIKRWGNSLALRITGAMAEIPNFKAGTKVDIEIRENGLLIKPITRSTKKLRLPYTEQQLVAELTPSLAHADELASLSEKEIGE